MANNSREIPSGLGHLDMVMQLQAITLKSSLDNLTGTEDERRLVGTAMSALYQAATCHRKCHGGPHIFEALCARMYNLAVGAYLLALSGLYDEALNLTRSIGEAANLIALSVVDKQALREWLSSDTKTRITKFSPKKVRDALKRKEPILLLANDDWYARFCEAYTHVTPQTKPNVHNPTGKGYAGGIYQAEGLARTLTELSNTLAPVSLLVCGYFKFEDLIAEIKAIVDSAEVDSDGAES